MMKLGLIAALLAVTGATLALVPAADAHPNFRLLWSAENGVRSVPNAFPGVKPIPLFKTPQDAAYCTSDETSYEDFSPSLMCWTPNDGWSATINWRGRRTYTHYFNRWPTIVHDWTKLKGFAPSARLLRFGQSWTYRCVNPADVNTCGGKSGVVAFRCVSRSTGLTCTNAAGHGYWIGRFRGYRLF